METQINTDTIGPNTTPIVEEKSANKSQYSKLFQGTDPFSQIYKWNPMGIRIVLNTPYVPSDFDPIFNIRVNPLVPDPAYYHQLTDSAAPYSNLFPVNASSGTGISFNEGFPFFFLESREKSKLFITHYGPEPMLSRLSRYARFWRGGISYSLRCTSNFTHQGNLVAYRTGPLPLPHANNENSVNDTGIDWLRMRPYLYKRSQYVNTDMANTFIQSDLSVERHLMITVPYELPYPYFDQSTYEDFGFYSGFKIGDNFRTEQYPYTSSIPYADNIEVSLKGAVAGGGDNQITYELYYKAEPDFTFGEFIIPPCAMDENISFLTFHQAIARRAITFPADLVEGTEIYAKNDGWYTKLDGQPEPVKIRSAAREKATYLIPDNTSKKNAEAAPYFGTSKTPMFEVDFGTKLTDDFERDLHHETNRNEYIPFSTTTTIRPTSGPTTTSTTEQAHVNIPNYLGIVSALGRKK